MQSTAKGRMSFSSTTTHGTHDSFQDHLSIRESIADRHPSLAVLSRLGSSVTESTYFSDIAKMPGLVTSSYEDRNKSNWSYSVSSRSSDTPLAKTYDELIEVIHVNILDLQLDSWPPNNNQLLNCCRMSQVHQMKRDDSEDKNFIWVKQHLMTFVFKLQVLTREIDGEALSLVDALEAGKKCDIDELPASFTDPKIFLCHALNKTLGDLKGITEAMEGRLRVNALTDVVSIMFKIFTLMNNSNYVENDRPAVGIESPAGKNQRKKANAEARKKRNKKVNKPFPQAAVDAKGAPYGCLNISKSALKSIQILAKILHYFKFFMFFALEWKLLKLKQKEGFFTNKEVSCFNFYKNAEYIPAIYKLRVDGNKL